MWSALIYCQIAAALRITKLLFPFWIKLVKPAVRKAFTLCYHNHDFELERSSNGKTILEAIFDKTHSINVKTELDVYWLTKAGENPVEWMDRYKNRTPLIHLKDMTTDGEQFFAELGTGGLILKPCYIKERKTELSGGWSSRMFAAVHHLKALKST